jgi:transaldolase
MAQVEGRPEDVIAQLADLCPGPVYYQLNAPTLAEREREAPQFTARPKPS